MSYFGKLRYMWVFTPPWRERIELTLLWIFNPNLFLVEFDCLYDTTQRLR